MHGHQRLFRGSEGASHQQEAGLAPEWRRQREGEQAWAISPDLLSASMISPALSCLSALIACSCRPAGAREMLFAASPGRCPGLISAAPPGQASDKNLSDRPPSRSDE